MEKLPGIGPRQALRFVWALLDFEPRERGRLAHLISSLDQNLKRCGACFRVFSPAALSSKPSAAGLCLFCQPDSPRDHSKIMVVERDSDLLNIEKSGIYKGLYHVLKGALDPLEGDAVTRERIKKLYERVNSNQQPATSYQPAGSKKPGAGSYEIILALSPNKLGEFTANYIEKVLEPLSKSQGIKISRLARGLSTGTDLEYADELTLRQALDNRK